jgi:hypothetical protein
MKLGRQNYTQQNHYCLNSVLFMFSWLLNVHRVNEFRQTELHTTEPLLPELSAFHVQLVIECT